MTTLAEKEQKRREVLSTVTPFEQIRRHGNRGSYERGGDFMAGNNRVICRDGFQFSVLAGYGVYSTPRLDRIAMPDLDVLEAKPVDLMYDPPQRPWADYTGPFWEFEVGFRGMRGPRDRRWRQYRDSSARHTYEVEVYAYVPKALIYDLIRRHGGQADYMPAIGWWPNEARHRMYRERNLAQMQHSNRMFSMRLQAQAQARVQAAEEVRREAGWGDEVEPVMSSQG